tara:strand:+ start:7297 stop:7554 length:258 start_codon:yes stop_codon:yes gene_type:complete
VNKLKFCVFCSFLTIFLLGTADIAGKSPPKSKFYDFNDQIIDGEVKRPTTLYTNARAKVKFDRLLRLKKSFLPRLFRTAKEKVFK